MADWGYSKHNGPLTWGDNVPAANGSKQSPIDVKPSEAEFDQALKDRPLEIKYDAEQAKTATNTGKSLMVSYGADGSLLEGGPLEHKYQVAQFHFHWGQADDTGSEHRVNDKMYAAEAHIVHYNSDLYASFGEAAAADHGLCVLGMLMQPGDEHKGLKKITDLIDKISHNGDTVDISGGFDPGCLLPEDRTKYWTYPGSLTTPPCYESVTWILFKEPIQVSEEQLEKLRHMHNFKSGDSAAKDDDFKGYIVENYRPPVSVNERRVRSSFQ